MFEISKEFAFSASHQLTHLNPDHPCARLHGHNYVVRVTLKGEMLDERGFVYDYRELDFFKQFIEDEIDHRHLNDVMAKIVGQENASRYTTAEHLAQFFFGWIFETGDVPELYSVSVSETPKTWATYTRTGFTSDYA